MSRESEIKSAAEVLVEAKKKVLEILSGPEHSSLSLSAGPQLQQIINRLYFLSGTAPGPDVETMPQFPPITNFMGEELNIKKAPVREEMEPNDFEKQTFIMRVENLYKELPTMSVAAVLNGYTQPEDVTILRGVAKKANVEGFADRVIDSRFVEEIISGIEKSEADATEQKKIDDELSKLSKSGSQTPVFRGSDGKLFNHIVTDEDLLENPELAQQGVKVGDTIQIPVAENKSEADATEQKTEEKSSKKSGSKK